MMVRQVFPWAMMLAGVVTSASSQVPLFSEVAADRGIITFTDHQQWGAGVSFHDWDRDGWPDLTFCRTGMPPAFYHNVEGSFMPVAFNIPNEHEAKSILWVDYDNDGDADLFITRYMGPWSLYRNNGSFVFTDVTEEAGLTQIDGFAWTMGAAWGDIDNDGHLDTYITTYNFNHPSITNLLFRSNGDGTFEDITLSAGVDNGSKTSFQVVFADFNMDGWADIHVTNDRFCCDNALYLNKGDLTFLDVSEQSGTAINIDAMSNTVADHDNDDDLDIYVSNHVAGNVLLSNNGDTTFSDLSAQSGAVVNEISWAALFLDQDLDGWKDLFVCTAPLGANELVTYNHFLTNDADGTFTYRDDSGMEGYITRSYCAATADFDNDGAPDIAIHNKLPHVAELWRNNSVGHTFVKVSLEGVTANRDGIGSTMRCYSGGMMQMQHLLCGEAHFGQSSQYLIFGLNGAPLADSITVHWPGGMVDRLEGLAAGQTYHVVEGMSQSVLVSTDDSTPTMTSTAKTVRKEVFDLLGRQIPNEQMQPGGPYIIRFMDNDGHVSHTRVLIR